jgi:UDP-2,3-diacylglucosamine pyrophosphatase LpxH
VRARLLMALLIVTATLVATYGVGASEEIGVVQAFRPAASGGPESPHSFGTMAPLQTGPSRTIVVLSDLHMGIGRDSSGAWHPYEDFRWPAELAEFLKAVDADGKSAVDLVLNGDTFELLQSVENECETAAAIGCTEPQALARLNRVLAAHDVEVKALAQFAAAGSNRVVFVPGDHDAALLFPRVAARVVSALGAPAGRVEVVASGYWISADRRVYAEHGHQIGFSAHRFENWPSPFVRRTGTEYLARPWGEEVVQQWYNRLEERYPVIDNVAVTGAGVKYALGADGVADIGDTAPRLFRYLLFTMSWQQFRMEIDDGEVQPPVWDLFQVRAQGAAFLVSTLPDDDRFKPLAAKALADGRLAKSVEALSDDEIVAICDYRAAMRRSRRRFEAPVSQFSPRGPVVTECPRSPETRGAIFDYFWQSRDLMFGRHLEAVTRRLPGGVRPDVFVHGHTHLPDRAQTGANMISGGLLKIPMEGFSPVRFALTPVIINGGAWQRTITPAQLERIKVDRKLSDADLLRALQLDELAPCYSFVHIPAYSDHPPAAVKYWRRTAAGNWAIETGCGGQ